MQEATRQAEAIRLEGLCKAFGPVKANHNVNLTVRRGEILALLGENGSGKTTLVNMLSGIYKPDSGSIYLNGRPVAIRSPREAIDLGVGMIHQHFKLVDVLTAWKTFSWARAESCGRALKACRSSLAWNAT